MDQAQQSGGRNMGDERLASRGPYGPICRSFNNQIATFPVMASRHRMSAEPLPSKSPTPTIDQLLGGAPRLADCVTCKPLTTQTATVPVLKSRQKMWPSLVPTTL